MRVDQKISPYIKQRRVAPQPTQTPCPKIATYLQLLLQSSTKQQYKTKQYVSEAHFRS